MSKFLNKLGVMSLILMVQVVGCKDFNEIEHWVIIYLENHSFDNLYGQFPSANNLDSSIKRNQYLQRDSTNQYYVILPAANRVSTNDHLFRNLPNKPFLIDSIVPSNQTTGDLVHRFFQNQLQINQGRNDFFVQISDAKALAMGYYRTDSLSLYPFARKYVLCDHFFQSAFGGSFLNHQYLVAARAPNFSAAPKTQIYELGDGGRIKRDGSLAVIAGDTFAVNTVYSRIAPHPLAIKDSSVMLPGLTYANIGTRLNRAGVSWKWYAGAWDSALAGKGDAILFQYHHQPLAYFKEFQVGSLKAKKHLKDESEFLKDIEEGTLPQVSFWKPGGGENEHPGYATLGLGEEKVSHVLVALENSPQWKKMAVVVTYDENGGFWDHVAPPQGDAFGPGTRVPALIISPWAKKSYVDKTQYETVSILKTLELRYHMEALSSRDAHANSFINAFDFGFDSK